MVSFKTIRDSTRGSSKDAITVETEFSGSNKDRYTMFKGNKNV